MGYYPDAPKNKVKFIRTFLQRWYLAKLNNREEVTITVNDLCWLTRYAESSLTDEEKTNHDWLCGELSCTDPSGNNYKELKFKTGLDHHEKYVQTLYNQISDTDPKIKKLIRYG